MLVISSLKYLSYLELLISEVRVSSVDQKLRQKWESLLYSESHSNATERCKSRVPGLYSSCQAIVLPRWKACMIAVIEIKAEQQETQQVVSSPCPAASCMASSSANVSRRLLAVQEAAALLQAHHPEPLPSQGQGSPALSPSARPTVQLRAHLVASLLGSLCL